VQGAGADKGRAPQNERTPLWTAAYNGHAAVVRALAGPGAINWTVAAGISAAWSKGLYQ